MADAEEIYHMANGSYTTDVRDLSLEIPSDCQAVAAQQMWSCGAFLVDMATLSNGAIIASYCPGQTKKGFSACAAAREFVLFFISSRAPTRIKKNV